MIHWRERNKFMFLNLLIQDELKGRLQKQSKWHFRPYFFFLVQMSSIFACDLQLNGKTLHRNFLHCFVSRFREIMQVFLNQPRQQMCASLILLFGKTKAFFGKDAARKKNCIFAYVICGKWQRNQQNKIGGTFFYEVESHMQKFGRGKKIWPKKSLTLFLQAPLQLVCYLVALKIPINYKGFVN